MHHLRRFPPRATVRKTLAYAIKFQHSIMTCILPLLVQSSN